LEELLHEGRAVGNKQLAEYLEVQGYAEAARWVYSQALEPGVGAPTELLTSTEVRHIHRLATAKVWDVAPHPQATADEGPGKPPPARHPAVPGRDEAAFARHRPREDAGLA
jgi:hypothetical protein